MRRYESDDPWFRVADFGVSTTAIVVGLATISMFVWAFEGGGGAIFNRLPLISENSSLGSVLEGEIWRLVTWPIATEPDLFIIIQLLFVFMIGSELERLMGRRPYTWFIGILIVVPALVATAAEVAFGITGAVFGLSFLSIALLIAFAAQYPNIKFFFGIPAWVMASVFGGLISLQILGAGSDYDVVVWVCVLVLALVGFRSFGYANDLRQIPRFPLPASMTGITPTRRRSTGRPARGGSRAGRSRNKRRSKANLTVVPPPERSIDPATEAEIDLLLDQVAEGGLESLTKDQRKRLEQHSETLRRRREQG